MSTNLISWGLIRQLKVEPFLFFYMFSYSLSSISISQLTQDKLCRFKYQKDAEYCLKINSEDSKHEDEYTKSLILTDVSYLSLYRMMLTTIPCVIWSLFIGSWSDNYIHGRKILMCCGCIGAVLESILLIINAANFSAGILSSLNF
jgi:hypothetical protein